MSSSNNTRPEWQQLELPFHEEHPEAAPENPANALSAHERRMARLTAPGPELHLTANARLVAKLRRSCKHPFALAT